MHKTMTNPANLSFALSAFFTPSILACILALCLFPLHSLIPCRFSLHPYNGLFPRYCLFGCRFSLHFHHFCPSFLWSFSLPVLLQCRVCIFFWLLVLVCGQSYHYHAHVARGVHIWGQMMKTSSDGSDDHQAK